MKKKLLPVIGLFLALTLPAQEEVKKEEGFLFTTIKENPITPVKNQNRSSTCWSYSGIGFLESELLRMGKGEYDFAEMFVVSHTMEDRAERYIRMHGNSSFLPGGSFYDVLYCMKHYGLVPQEAMPGIMYGDSLPVHTELDIVASGYVTSLINTKITKLTPVWKKGLVSIYDTYLGKRPEKFTYKGKEYTPETFAASTGLKAEDYISLTSFTHHPFYSEFSLEIPDNWRNALSWNIPLEEFMEVIDHAIDNGYTVAWGSDVSEIGFSREGIAVVPVDNPVDLTGSDMARWTGLSVANKKKELTSKPLPEKEITQELRQIAYDNWESQDDHGMLIYGVANDQNGKPYYMVKNSWGTNNPYKGTWYASKAFVAYKTINIVVHKDGIPKSIAAKLGLK